MSGIGIRYAAWMWVKGLVMSKRAVLAYFFLLVFPVGFAVAKEATGPITLENVEFLMKEGVAPGRVATLVRERGINFEVTAEVRERLKRAGADAVVMQAVERAAVEYAKRKLKEEPKTIRPDFESDTMLIPAGEFVMGSDDGDSDEKPRRRVYVDAFLIDKYEVTNSQFRGFMEAAGWAAPSYWNNSRFNGPTQPVVGVSWHDADAYCRWVGKRLPTEAEWEKAARGADGRRFPWGNASVEKSKAQYNSDSPAGTVSVGSFPDGASPYGVHDMAGNVWEWVSDWYDKSYYQRAPIYNPKGPDTGQLRVLRGGSWNDGPRNLRSSNRSSLDPENRSLNLGFRCVR